MPSRKATKAEVQEYFNRHPEHLELIILDLKETDDPDVTRDTIHEFTDFIIDPEVGVMPTYWMDELRSSRTPEWSSTIADLYEYSVYKILWFVAVHTVDFDDHEIMTFPSNQLEHVISDMEIRAEEHDANYSEYFYGWQSKQFSNGKKFNEVDSFPDIKIDDLEEVECVYATGFPEPRDLRAALLISGKEIVYVCINSYDQFFLMQVDSINQARKIMSEVW
jgi:hypothetical protein